MIGNLIAAFVLGNLNDVVYFYMMTGIAAFGTIVFATLRDPLKVVDTIEDGVPVATVVNRLYEK